MPIAGDAAFCYHGIAGMRGGAVSVNLPEKILALRKARGMSQADLAEKLYVTRQTVSRWERGSAAPDAENLLRLAQVFDVSVDELLGNAPAAGQPAASAGFSRMLFCFAALELMLLLIQFLSVCVLKSVFFGLLSCLPIACLTGGFAYAYRRHASRETAAAAAFRRRLFQITAWLGTYFPVRLLLMAVSAAVPLFTVPAAFEAVTAVIYLMTALLLTLRLELPPAASG